MGKMRRVMLIVAVVIAAIVLLATIVCNSGYVQNRLISLATDALKKELNIEVQIEGIGINLLGQHVTFYGVSLKDQQQRDLVRVKEIFGDFRLLPLMSGHVALKECRLNGIRQSCSLTFRTAAVRSNRGRFAIGMHMPNSPTRPAILRKISAGSIPYCSPNRSAMTLRYFDGTMIFPAISMTASTGGERISGQSMISICSALSSSALL